MRCTSPRTVGFHSDGKTICWSPKQYSKEYATFQIPCGKCLECRLEYARQTAIRCVHEASMHPENSFITLTYNDENIGDNRLRYRDFQLFVKRLRRKYPTQQIGVYVAGEYGDKKKRAHWHALIFNWRPQDLKPKYTNERGDQIFSSDILDNLWGLGLTEIGSVTFESAGYCARYATKKLAHGHDNTHDYEPISKRSSRHAIGKTWIEKYWPDVFRYGELHFNGKIVSIPRYYEKWLKKTHPAEWTNYVTIVKRQKIKEAIDRETKITNEEKRVNRQRSGLRGLQIKRENVRARITQKRVNENLMKHTKL